MTDIPITAAMGGSLERSTMFIVIPETGKHRMELQEYMLNGYAVKERWAFQMAEDIVQLTEGEEITNRLFRRSYQGTIN